MKNGKINMYIELLLEKEYPKRDQAMLAIPFQEDILNRWNTSYYYIQPKINGIRAVFKNDKLFSLQGNVFNSVPHINEIIIKLGLNKYFQIDGELYNPQFSLQMIRSIAIRKNIHRDFKKIKYYIFDTIDPKKNFEERHEDLKKWEPIIEKTPILKIVPTFKVYDKDEIWKYLKKFKEKGFEGIIIRNPKGLYKIGKRSNDLLKFKPMRSDKYLIVGVTEEKDIHGNPKNALGAFILSDKQGNKFKVGTGPMFTRETRIKLWKERDALIGRYAIIKYVETTERGIPFQSIVVQII